MSEISSTAIALSILALILTVGLAGYVFLNSDTEATDLSGIESQVDSNKKDINSVDSKVEDASGAISTLISEVRSLKNQRFDFDFDEDDIRDDIDDVEDDINDLEEAVRDCVNVAINSESIDYVDHDGNNRTLSFDEFDENDWNDCLDDVY